MKPVPTQSPLKSSPNYTIKDSYGSSRVAYGNPYRQDPLCMQAQKKMGPPDRGWGKNALEKEVFTSFQAMKRRWPKEKWIWGARIVYGAIISVLVPMQYVLWTIPRQGALWAWPKICWVAGRLYFLLDKVLYWGLKPLFALGNRLGRWMHVGGRVLGQGGRWTKGHMRAVCLPWTIWCSQWVQWIASGITSLVRRGAYKGYGWLQGKVAHKQQQLKWATHVAQGPWDWVVYGVKRRVSGRLQRYALLLARGVHGVGRGLRYGQQGLQNVRYMLYKSFVWVKLMVAYRLNPSRFDRE